MRSSLDFYSLLLRW